MINWEKNGRSTPGLRPHTRSRGPPRTGSREPATLWLRPDRIERIEHSGLRHLVYDRPGYAPTDLRLAA
jgi:hypothetical protein